MSQRTDSSLPPDDDAPRADEPRQIDPSAGSGQRLGRRDFADAGNFAADQRRQNKERGEGLGAGGSDNRDARHPASDPEREVAEDDID
jgi:hypothetical protein